MAAHQLPASWVIVGSGFYPWLVALFLQKTLVKPLQRAGRQPIRLTLLQQQSAAPERVITTSSALRHFNKNNGLSEANFVRGCRACFNLGTVIQRALPTEDRSLSGAGAKKSSGFFFAEGPYGYIMRGVRFHHLLAHGAAQGFTAKLDAFSVAAQLAQQNRFTPPSTRSDSLFSSLDYGYRFHAAHYTEYLSKLLEDADISVYRSGLSRVQLEPDHQSIAALELDNGDRVSGDFFIDVSENRVLKSALPKSDHCVSPCHPTAVLQTAGVQTRDSKAPLKPYQHLMLGRGEISIASTSHKQGYSQQFAVAASGENSAKVFWDLQPWQGNCVALGPALSNRPPIIIDEVHSLLNGLHELARFWPKRDATDTDAVSKKWFNRNLSAEGEQIFDMDSFLFKASFAHFGAELSHGAKEMLALFCETGVLPAREQQTLAESQWIALLYALGLPLKFDNILARQFDGAALVKQLTQLKKSIQQAAGSAPLHEEFLRLNRLV